MRLKGQAAHGGASIRRADPGDQQSTSSVLCSVRIPSSYQMAGEIPRLTWDFLIRCVRPKDLAPPSISDAFPLLSAVAR